MLHCDKCLQWFAEGELDMTLPKDFPPGCVNYEFLCADCGENGAECLSRHDGIKGALIAALHGLHAKRIAEKAPAVPPEEVSYFDFRDEIIPYIEENWASITGNR